MKRDEYIRILSELAGPLGPFGTIEYSDKKTNDWYDTFDTDSIDVLIDLLLNPPSKKELGYEIPEYFDVELDDALVSIGKKFFAIFLEKIKVLIELKHLRVTIIYILGGIGHQEGLGVLSGFIENSNDLTDDEIFGLIDSLGRIGGIKAEEKLEQMKIMYSDQNDILKQIEIWLKNIKNKDK
ncbi:HEAT repeat domain-containing protein [Acetivibrio cellulolyticus]|uniref:HEAT repeat domain-containing protein n=1 Tax=Acetivibrio cellulolyticus TaxID=35830 RepID=UPI0001E3018D|nr:HEAT repeat domain-containing protein [Acetivibrio cellulolyticus]